MGTGTWYHASGATGNYDAFGIVAPEGPPIDLERGTVVVVDGNADGAVATLLVEDPSLEIGKGVGRFQVRPEPAQLRVVRDLSLRDDGRAVIDVRPGVYVIDAAAWWDEGTAPGGWGEFAFGFTVRVTG